MAPRGDYRHRETKKAKKIQKKALVSVPLVMPSEVEVVRKKKERKVEEES